MPQRTQHETPSKGEAMSAVCLTNARFSLHALGSLCVTSRTVMDSTMYFH